MQSVSVVLACCILFLFVTFTSADYWEDRARLIKEEGRLSVGASLVLSDKEKEANRILMRYKLRDLSDGFKNLSSFLAGEHFFKSKEGIRNSEVFKIIRKLPKGASLHSHDIALTSAEYAFNLTRWPELYASWNNKTLFLHFFKEKPSDATWHLVSDLRRLSPNFDAVLRSGLTMVVKNPRKRYTNVNLAWTAFVKAMTTVESLLVYRPVWEVYLYQALKELHQDNVKYLEFRTVLPELYDTNGTVYNGVQVMSICHGVVQKFKEDYPDFFGVRIIYAPRRHVDKETIAKYIELCLELHEQYPDFLAGFDLVGQEDLGPPLTDFIPQLLPLKEKGVKFFFHAGETKWNGQSSDMNLFDAILLNSTRIGHGYAILKHPILQDIVKKRQIAVEISPISNQVLNLVDDFRNHPASIMIANNFPLVVSCDDPLVWGAEGLSYDWYVAFMALTSEKEDLRFLKQLALNSLEFSAMGEREKEDVLKKWMEDWDRFVDGLVNPGVPEVINL